VAIFRTLLYIYGDQDALLTKFNELKRKNEEALLGGGEKELSSNMPKAKLTARERVELLLDEGSVKSLANL